MPASVPIAMIRNSRLEDQCRVLIGCVSSCVRRAWRLHRIVTSHRDRSARCVQCNKVRSAASSGRRLLSPPGQFARDEVAMRARLLSRLLRSALAAALVTLPVLPASAVPTAVFPQAGAPPGPPIAITGASVINVEDGSVIQNAVVLIDGD